MRKCSGCGVKPGKSHAGGCGVARCSKCGFQLIGCGHRNADGGIWTGEWPGVAECRALGLWALFVPGSGWKSVTEDTPGATEDLNTLVEMGAHGELVWDGARWSVPARIRM